MAYNTHYKLTAEPLPSMRGMEVTNISELLADAGIGSSMVLLRQTAHNVTESHEFAWYEHEKEMRSLSKRYSMLLFTLEGQGDDKDDRWRKYFVNGAMQEARACITFAEFNARELR